jgi:ATP-binding cassette subfamily F protein uup
MSVLSVREVTFNWSGEPLLEDISLEIDRGERIGLLGRNGAGKSTLMKLIAGEVVPDQGTVSLANGIRVGRLVQEVPVGTEQSVGEIVLTGWSGLDDSGHDWEADQAVDRVLSRMGLDRAARFQSLSSGMKRRVLLAQSLVQQPDVLLLDEPTNHLDIESITWLEGFLQQYEGTLIFVTHDRAFLQSLATRILEIDRGRLFDWTCSYSLFLQRKQQWLEAEEKQNALFDKKLAAEEVWIRQGIKARRTRNEGRVRALKKMREERRQRREKVGQVRMQVSGADRSGQLVLEARDIGFSYGDRPIIRNFSTVISRGDKIGIIGPNGAGKSTLLKLILGELQPDSGALRQGSNLQVIYFDQLREQIDEDKSIVENVGEGQETIEVNGQRKHIYGYLQDFLFTPERARRAARLLSGGERNRMLLARLFKRPSNVMVLDEPTNDLDAETLELLEELVASYEGTVLLVSHDREFLNNVVTSTLVLSGDGTVTEYDGGYDDYLRQRNRRESEIAVKSAPKESPASAPSQQASPRQKLSFKERQELEKLPDLIEQLETQQSELHTRMADPGFYRQPGNEIAAVSSQVADLEARLAHAYERWETLSAREA